MEDRKKVVFIGDNRCGKTSLFDAIANDRFQKETRPTDYQYFESAVDISGRRLKYEIVDVNGSEEYAGLRPFAYPKTNTILVCFSVVSLASFERITKKWIPEVKRHCPNARIVLVGTMTDLRDHPQTMKEMKKKRQKPVTAKKGRKMAKKINVYTYVECSSLKMEGIRKVLETAVGSKVEPEKEKKKFCCLTRKLCK